MLARRYRLTKKDNVEEIMTQGHVAKSRLFVVRSLPNNLPYNRTMALVSSNVADRAPNRNRIRRQIYEIVRLEEQSRTKRGFCSSVPNSPAPAPFPHFDLVIFPKKAVKDAPFKEIQRQLLSLLNHRAYLRPNPS